MARIRVEAAAKGALALGVSASTAKAEYDNPGIVLRAEPQDGEVFISASPIITEVIYRASFNTLNHEILLTTRPIPVTFIPAVNFSVVDSTPLFSIEPLYIDTVTINEVLTFDASVSLADTANIVDTPVITVSRPLADSFGLSDAQLFNVGLSRQDTANIADDLTFSVSSTMATDAVRMTDVFDYTRILPTLTPSDSVSVSQNIVLQSTKPVVDSISASDNTYEIGAFFEGDGGLFNSAGLISETPPLNKEFALQLFST